MLGGQGTFAASRAFGRSNQFAMEQAAVGVPFATANTSEEQVKSRRSRFPPG